MKNYRLFNNGDVILSTYDDCEVTDYYSKHPHALVIKRWVECEDRVMLIYNSTEYNIYNPEEFFLIKMRAE